VTVARGPKIEEERPPHRAIEGVVSPRETDFLVGHRAAEQALLDAYRSGRMHHGWVLCGERGIGKTTLAFRLARFMLAHPDPLAPDVAEAPDLTVPAEHPAARKVAAGVHPNLLHLQREWDEKRRRYKSELSVDTVRRVTPFLGTTAAEAGWRVVIVDPADDMSRSAANAILKILEEPPRRTLFLLVARSRGGLLPTILSRCRTLELDPLAPEETEEVVRRAASDPAEARQDGLAAALAGGSPRRLIELRKHDGVAVYRLMLEALGGDRQAQLRLSTLAAEPATMDQFLDLFEGYLLRRVHGLPEPGQGAAPPGPPLVSWAELWEKAALSGQEVETYNLDRRQFVLDLLESAAARLHASGMPNVR
jgi:DNA polymerase-3 subunit delta'